MFYVRAKKVECLLSCVSENNVANIVLLSEGTQARKLFIKDKAQ